MTRQLNRLSAPLANRTIIVSGGGGAGRDPKGVGEAVCEMCADSGAAVVVVSRNGRLADDAARRIVESGGQALAIVADLSREADCARVVATTGERFGAIHGLVGNVAIAEGAPVPLTKEADWDRVVATNTKSLLFLAKHALPLMPPGGTIVTVSSITVARPAASAAYGASKAAAEALTLQMAMDQGPRGIRCNIVRVGEVWATMSARGCVDAAARGARKQLYAQKTVLGEIGLAEDVARAVLFFLGPQSRWITGQILTVDGGASLLRADPQWRGAGHPVAVPDVAAI